MHKILYTSFLSIMIFISGCCSKEVVVFYDFDGYHVDQAVYRSRTDLAYALKKSGINEIRIISEIKLTQENIQEIYILEKKEGISIVDLEVPANTTYKSN